MGAIIAVMGRALLVALVIAAAGCGGSGEPAATPQLADGRYFGYIRWVGEPTIAFDRAQFLMGEAANEAAVADHAIEEGETAPNDYYIRNRDHRVVELSLADDVRVTAVRCAAGCKDGVAGDFDAWAASFSTPGQKSLMDDYRGAQGHYWVTIRHGRVIAIEEQYLP
jgi:hypothetical protein